MNHFQENYLYKTIKVVLNHLSNTSKVVTKTDKLILTKLLLQRSCEIGGETKVIKSCLPNKLKEKTKLASQK